MGDQLRVWSERHGQAQTEEEQLEALRVLFRILFHYRIPEKALKEIFTITGFRKAQSIMLWVNSLDKLDKSPSQVCRFAAYKYRRSMLEAEVRELEKTLMTCKTQLDIVSRFRERDPTFQSDVDLLNSKVYEITCRINRANRVLKKPS